VRTDGYTAEEGYPLPPLPLFSNHAGNYLDNTAIIAIISIT